ncbi:MAG: hypothetical protein J6W13_14095 [Salinivirgaceae bacterium]|nr:hypothetical protein [Salinivirgaceae bacterium]
MKTKEEMDKYYSDLAEQCENEGKEEWANGYRPPLKPFFVLNEKDTEHSLFPHSQWELKLLQGDSEPARFHVIGKGWDVTFGIESGEVLNVLADGTEKADYEYACSHIKDWLKADSLLMGEYKNIEFARLMWKCFFAPFDDCRTI